FILQCPGQTRQRHSFPTRRSSDLATECRVRSTRTRQTPRISNSLPGRKALNLALDGPNASKSFPLSFKIKMAPSGEERTAARFRSEEHTSELQSPDHLVCRLLLEK